MHTGLFPLSVPSGQRRRSAQCQPSAGAVRLQEDLLPQSHTGESFTESLFTGFGSLSPFCIELHSNLVQCYKNCTSAGKPVQMCCVYDRMALTPVFPKLQKFFYLPPSYLNFNSNLFQLADDTFENTIPTMNQWSIDNILQISFCLDWCSKLPAGIFGIGIVLSTGRGPAALLPHGPHKMALRAKFGSQATAWHLHSFQHRF